MANSHDSTEPVAWAMPKGDGTFIDVITPAEHARDEGSYTVPLFAHPVAQQPQAEAAPVAVVKYQVGGLVVHIVGDVQEGDELFKTPQQAEAVPSSDLNPDEGDPVTLWAEIWRLREAVKGPDGYATWQDAATAERIRRVRAESKQAEEAKAVPTHDDTDLIKQMLEALRSCSGVSHWPALVPTINAARKRLEAPQQAEAVPPTHVLVPVDVLKAASESLGNFVSDHGWTDADMRAMDNLDAIIAQQKGGV